MRIAFAWCGQCVAGEGEMGRAAAGGGGGNAVTGGPPACCGGCAGSITSCSARLQGEGGVCAMDMLAAGGRRDATRVAVRGKAMR